MKIDNDELKQRLMQFGPMVASIQIDESFWDPAQPYYQVPNNHTMLMLRNLYHSSEYDDEFKATFGKFLDFAVWMYITFPEWRARLGWITWFLQMYVVDKQLYKEPLPPGWEGQYDPEVWTDPRKWMLAEQVNGLPVETTQGPLVDLSTPGGEQQP